MDTRWYLKRLDRGAVGLVVEEAAPPHRGILGRFNYPDQMSRADLRCALRCQREALEHWFARPAQPSRTFDPLDVEEA